jgi:hypothetical protein
MTQTGGLEDRFKINRRFKNGGVEIQEKIGRRKGTIFRRKKRHQSPETEKVPAYGGRKDARDQR